MARGGDRFDVGGAPHAVGAENLFRLAHGLLRFPVAGGFSGHDPFHGDFLRNDTDDRHICRRVDIHPFLEGFFVFHVGQINKRCHG